MRFLSLVLTLVLPAAVMVADDRTIIFDEHLDFSTLKTFSIRDGRIGTSEPALNNALVREKILDAIRSQLTARGLAESPASDVIATFELEFNPGLRRALNDDTQAILVVDLMTRDSRLIWRGTYRDTELHVSKTASQLPDDVKKLLSKYPPKQR